MPGVYGINVSSCCIARDAHIILILMVIISLELTRVNPDRNIFSINVELTSTFFALQRFGPSPSPNFKLKELFAYFQVNLSHELNPLSDQ